MRRHFWDIVIGVLLGIMALITLVYPTIRGTH